MALRTFAIWPALRALYAKRSGETDVTKFDYSFGNNTPLLFRNAADTADIEALNVDSDNYVLLAGEQRTCAPHIVTLNVGANGNQGSQHIWIAPFACRIKSVTEIHKTAGNHSAAVTAYVEKLTGTTAVGSGVSVMSGTFNLKGTANTLQTATLATVHPRNDGLSQDIFLAAGDRLALVVTGNTQTLAGVQVTIAVVPGGKGSVATYHAKTNSDIATQTFFIANRPQTVLAAYAVWGTASSDAGAVTLDITADASATAAGGGTTILSAAKSMKTTANTVNTLTLTATAANLRLAPGTRLSFKLTGTPTSLADLTIVVLFSAVENRKCVSFCNLASDVGTDLAFFTADRDYEVIDVSAVWGTASTSAFELLTIDTGTTAPGAGTGQCSDNTNTGFDTSASAATPVWGTLVAGRLRWLTSGDRLAIKKGGAGVVGSLAGACYTVSLRPR